MNIQVIRGTREGSSVYTCGDGFHYHRNHGYMYGDMRSSISNLRCIHHYSRQCQGTAKVTLSPDGNEWTNLNRHTCAPDRLYERIKEMRRTIVQAATAPDGPYEQPAALVDRLRLGICATRDGVNIAARLTPAAMKSAVQRARSAHYPLIPLTMYDLGQQLYGQHRRITKTNDGADNIFGGMVEGPDYTSLVFISRRMRRFMSRVRVLFIDGTFGSRPNSPNCAQVLQLCTVVRNHVVPLGQVLMTGKSQDEYVAVLRHITQIAPNFRPTVIMTDYEVGLQNACEMVFNTRVAGCYWHFCRAVIRHAKELGLAPAMNENRRIRSIIRSACAVPLLPREVIPRGVQTLIDEAARLGFLPLLMPFFDYFVDTWLSPHMLKRLSVFRLKHRTNNVAESANKLLKNRTRSLRPGIWQFMSALRQNELAAFVSLRTMQLGLPLNRARKVTSVNNDRRIINYTIDLMHGMLSINTFLHRCSTRVMNVFNNMMG